MEQHHITAMEAQAKEVHASMLGLTADEPMSQLIKIIHNPGFTTPAEAAFLSGILEAMLAHTHALSGLQKTALDGASSPPPTQDFNPQPDPPGKGIQTDLNPQPLPPGKGIQADLNPQPLPPGKQEAGKQKQ
jgi:hypothetical protein